MNSFTPKKLFLVHLALLLSLTFLGAQGYETVILDQNTSFQESFQGFTPIFLNSPDNGVASTNSNNGTIQFTYTPDQGYTGRDTVYFQYRTGPPPRGDIYYVGYDFDIRTSLVGITIDYHTMFVNGGPDTINVMHNDSSSAGGLELTDLVVVPMGDGGIVGDSMVWFEPLQDSAGISQIDYKVCDSLNSCEIGQLIIMVVDTNQMPTRDTIVRFTKENYDLDIIVPDLNFGIQQNPSNGILTQESSQVFNYDPDPDFTGKDTFLIETPGQIIRDVVIHVLPYDEPNKFLVDDEVFTAEGVMVSFNVQDNDPIGTRFKVKNYTEPDEGILTPRGNGNFDYTPPAGFSGLKKFTYTVCPSQNNCETAEVSIFVSNSKPENTFNYQFNTLKNVPLVIDYQVPISYFEFEEHLAPVHGALDIFDGPDTIIVECDTISGYNLVVYYPDTDFYGEDEFELEYIIPQTNYTAVIKVEVNVINDEPDSTCACINGCVWPGDVDYDGRVTMKDLLPLGYFVGSAGPARDTQSVSEWIGLHCDDWTPALNSWQINPKHADTDGSGLVNAIDTQAIIDFYYNEHNLVEKDISLPRQFPLIMEPLFTSLDSGETAVILVGIGDEDNPVYDLSGFTYSYFYDPSIVDSSSLKIDFHNDCWFADQSPVLDLYKQPWDGRVDAGFTRTGGKTTTGFGIVSTLSFGVEEDIEGFKKLGNDRTVVVRIDDGYAMNGSGEIFRIPGTSIELKLTGEAEDPNTPADPTKLAVFPNPTNSIVRLFLNGQNRMTEASVFTATGQQINSYSLGRTQKAELNLGYLPNGLYLLRVETIRGPIVKKVQVIH